MVRSEGFDSNQTVGVHWAFCCNCTKWPYNVILENARTLVFNTDTHPFFQFSIFHYRESLTEGDPLVGKY